MSTEINSNQPLKKVYKKYHEDFQYQKEHGLEYRLAESSKIRTKYPNRYPIICEKANGSDIEDIDKNKYLVPHDLTVGQFSYVIRKRLNIKPETAIFILVENTFPTASTEIKTLYDEYKHQDGFLYLKYSGEPTFG